MPIAPPEKVGNEFLVGGGEFSSITNLTNGRFVVSLASGGGVALEAFDGGMFIGWTDCCPKAAPVMPIAT